MACSNGRSKDALTRLALWTTRPAIGKTTSDPTILSLADQIATPKALLPPTVPAATRTQ